VGVNTKDQSTGETQMSDEALQDGVSDVDAEPGTNPEPDHEALESDADKDWKMEFEKLEQQVAEYKDQALRAVADAQNARRRAELDIEKAHKFALEKFAKELLPVLDSLEKAVEAEQALGGEMTPLREGVEMTLNMFIAGVRKFSLEQVDPAGEPFDPALHEAVSVVEAPDTESNSVVAVIQKGYTLNGRLIRPAMVVVSK
jgi:molecular chaperone GrpE